MNHSTTLISIQMLEAINAALRARVEAPEPRSTPAPSPLTERAVRMAATTVSFLLMGAAVGVLLSWS